MYNKTHYLQITLKLHLAIKSKLKLFQNKLRLTIQFKRTKYFFTISLFEGYKKFILILKIILTAISLLLSFIAFQSPIIASIVGFIFYLALTFLSKTVFSYRPLYIHPLPDFKIQFDKWVGCFFGFADAIDKSFQVPLVGFAISEEEYARSLHEFILRLTFNKQNDIDRNIRISIIEMSDDKYMFFLYPNILKTNAHNFYKKVEKERKRVSLTDEQNKMAITPIFRKSFKNSRNSYFTFFKSKYEKNQPIELQIYLQNNGNIIAIKDLYNIRIHDFSIKKRSELTQKDLEFDLIRIFHDK